MAGVVFSVVLSLSCLRSVLVLDAVSSSNIVSRVTQAVSMGTDEVARRRRISVASRQQAPTTATGASRIRMLHKRLLAMHFIACIHAIAGIAEYMLPVSDTSCLTHKAVIGTLLLYDASLVLFLLAKTSVTNGNRELAGWETCITWWSRVYAWGYLPLSAFFLALFLPVVANEEGSRCLTGTRQEGERGNFSDTVGFLTNNMMLIVQFVLLLAMFIKPMLLPQSSTQSGGAVYRRVVNRNILCTVCIVFTYTITTIVVVVALLGSSFTAAEIADATPAINIILTLFLTEIALPLGVSSCFKSVVASTKPTSGGLTTVRQPNSTLARGKTQAPINRNTGPTIIVTAAKQQPTITAVVPFEEEDVP